MGKAKMTIYQVLGSYELFEKDFSKKTWAAIKGAVEDYHAQFKGVRGKASNVDECYQDYVDMWVKKYPDLGFNQVSGRMIKTIILEGRKWIKANGKEDTKERVNGLFAYVLAYVERVGHFCHNKPLTVWRNQYMSIIAEIKNGKQQQRKLSKADETREFLNSIRGSR